MLTMPKNKRIFIAAAAVIIMSCITVAGHFLFWKSNSRQPDSNDTNIESTPDGISNNSGAATETGTITGTGTHSNGEISGTQTASISDADGYVSYERIETEINGNKQVINILEAKLGAEEVIVKPALSFGLIYGFEELSKMVENSGAYAGVNGGFFSVYGEPAGMVMIDGELCAKPTGNYPVFITDGKTASLEKIRIEMSLKNRNAIQVIDKINTAGAAGEIILYTPVYGSTNRAKSANIAYVIENGKVVEINTTAGVTEIPGDGMVLTYYTPYPEKEMLQFEIGDSVSFEYSPYLGSDAQAYECGCMIVENGKNVSPAADPWIGVLTNHDPRTVLGIKDKTTVVLITVDGRQPGYSTGITASELADYLIGIGVEDAAMLDGGASTEMIVDGRMVNKPSYGGRERKIAGAVLIFKAEGTGAGD